MRSLLLASAAVLITAGVACAQTASPTPAPTGSTGEPTATSPTAGKTAPGYVNGPASSPSDTPMASSDTGSSTVPNSKTSTGTAGSMATKSDPAPAMSSGMSSSNTGASGMASTNSGSGSMGTGMTHTHHMWSGTMPADADAHTYLKIASMAIKNHDKMTADEALSRAETRMLTRSVVASGPMTDDSPGVTAVENARQAVDAGNFHEAMVDTDMAMHHHMAGDSGMGGDDQASDTSPMSNQSSGSAMPGQGSSSPGMSAGAASGSQQ